MAHERMVREAEQAVAISMKRYDAQKESQARAPSWWPRQPIPVPVAVAPGQPRIRPPSPRTVAAADARLRQIESKLEAGQELDEAEVSDAEAILELKQLWAEREKVAAKEAAVEEALQRRQGKRTVLPPLAPAGHRASAVMQKGGHEVAALMVRSVADAYFPDHTVLY